MASDVTSKLIIYTEITEFTDKSTGHLQTCSVGIPEKENLKKELWVFFNVKKYGRKNAYMVKYI